MAGFVRSIVNNRWVAKSFSPLLRRTVTIYSVHRFSGRRALAANELVRRLELIRATGANVMSLRQVIKLAEAGDRIPDHTVVFTVDDGYRDFAEVGAKIFADFGFPVTVFLITGFLDGKMWPWWDKLNYCLVNTPLNLVHIDSESLTADYHLRDIPEINAALEDLSGRFKLMTSTQRADTMDEVAQTLGVNLPSGPPKQYAPMTWDQVRSFNGTNVSFGPHTVLHPILSRESAEVARQEIIESWHRLSQEIEDPVPVFAYPNGTPEDFGPREVGLLKAAGMKGALTTEYNYVTDHSLESRYYWPRFPLEGPLDGLVQIVSGAERAKIMVRGTGHRTLVPARPNGDRLTAPPPVFVTGFQRSGTTMLGNLIDRHPDIAIFLESFFIPRYQVLQVFYWPLRNKGNAQRLANAIAAEPSSIENNLRADLGGKAQEIKTYGELVAELMRTWASDQGKKRWGDKSPGYITKLPTLARICPGAKFVHIIRDGRDIWLSVKKLGWESNVVTIARQWRSSVRRARRQGRTQLVDQYFECQYEKLTQDPAAYLQRISVFIDESYSPDLLNDAAAGKRNPSFKDWPKINEAIDPSNTAKWKKQLPADEIALFEHEAGNLLEELGYGTSGYELRAALRLRLYWLRLTSVTQQSLRFVTRVSQFFIRAIVMRFKPPVPVK